jgi:hypothetical protein
MAYLTGRCLACIPQETKGSNRRFDSPYNHPTREGRITLSLELMQVSFTPAILSQDSMCTACILYRWIASMILTGVCLWYDVGRETRRFRQKSSRALRGDGGGWREGDTHPDVPLLLSELLYTLWDLISLVFARCAHCLNTH